MPRALFTVGFTLVFRFKVETEIGQWVHGSLQDQGPAEVKNPHATVCPGRGDTSLAASGSSHIEEGWFILGHRFASEFP